MTPTIRETEDFTDYPYSASAGWVEWTQGTQPESAFGLVDYRDAGRTNGFFTADAADVPWECVISYRSAVTSAHAETMRRIDRVKAPATPSIREAFIVTGIMLAVFAALMLIGFPLRFDGAMPWELMGR